MFHKINHWINGRWIRDEFLVFTFQTLKVWILYTIFSNLVCQVDGVDYHTRNGWKYIRCFFHLWQQYTFWRGFGEFQNLILGNFSLPWKRLKSLSWKGRWWKMFFLLRLQNNRKKQVIFLSHNVTCICAEDVLRSTMAHLPWSMIRPITHFTWLRSTNSMGPKSS